MAAKASKEGGTVTQVLNEYKTIGVIGPLQRALYDSITLNQIEFLAQIAEHLGWSTADAGWADTQKWDVCYTSRKE